MSDPKEPSEEQTLLAKWMITATDRIPTYESKVMAMSRKIADRDVARDAAQFRRGVEAAVAIVERNYFAAESLTDLRNLRGDDDG